MACAGTHVAVRRVMNRTIWVMAAVTLLSGCDAVTTTDRETLDCTVRRNDGGAARDVLVQCTGAEDAGAVTNDAGAFTISVLVTQGGFAGWTDSCGPIVFNEGDTRLDARWQGNDGGILARMLDGVGSRAQRCGITVE